jgi:putative membrane protein
VTDEYLDDRFQWRYLNAPFYVVAIALVLAAVSGYVLSIEGYAAVEGVRGVDLSTLAVALTGGTLLGVLSTLTFAVAESRFPSAVEAA